MKRRSRYLRYVCALASSVVVGSALAAPAASAEVSVGPGGHVPGTSRNFVLVGHAPLANRGMNAALAVFGRYVYVGNRTDGSSRCGVRDPRIAVSGLDSCPHAAPGIQVVDNDDCHASIAGNALQRLYRFVVAFVRRLLGVAW